MNGLHNEFDVRLFADGAKDVSTLRAIREQAIARGIGNSSVGVVNPVVLEGAVTFLVLDCELSDVKKLLRSLGVKLRSVSFAKVKIEEKPNRRGVK